MEPLACRGQRMTIRIFQRRNAAGRNFWSCLLLFTLGGCGQDSSVHRSSVKQEVATQDEAPSSATKPISEQDQQEASEEPLTGSKNPPTPALPPSSKINQEFISSFLTQIAGNDAAGRLTGSPQNRLVAELIAQEFTKIGLRPGGTGGSYFQSFTANSQSLGTVASQNIIGVLGPGNSEEVIIVGAHMDHLGVRNGQTYFGADDNASGTAALIAAAKALASVEKDLKRTVIFIAFSGEELGLLGSLHYVRNPTVPLSQIKFMLNMDMVGYSKGALDAIGFGKTLEADRLVKELIPKTGLTPRYYAATGGGSDHMPFEQLNIPTGVFHTGVHENYHQPTDSLEKIDLLNLAKISGLAADLVASLASGRAITLRPIELEPLTYYGLHAGLHSGGCSPGLSSFEAIEQSLAGLRLAP